MPDNIYLFFLFYFTILFSIIGYGFFFNHVIGISHNSINFGYTGLFGLFLGLIISYLSNFFLAHDYIFNSIFIIVGLFLFSYTLLKKFSFYKKEFLILLIVFFCLFISSLAFKTHDDFPYYHFPYTYYLTQQDLALGVGQFNHGFRTPSSIFYLSSLFYLPFIEYYAFQFAAIYILGFSNIILLKKFYYLFADIKFKKIDFINYLSLFAFIFINIFFYRISEHGTDRSAQILIFLLVIEILYFANLNKFSSSNLLYVYTLLAIIISLKSFYFLYLLFLFPLFIYFFEKNKNLYLTIKVFIFNRCTIVLSSLIFFVLATYFFNTGCLIYPVSFTCFENFDWALPITEVERMNNHYELWSKAGRGPNFIVDNPDEYIKNFYWTSHWIREYFFNKVSDFLLGLIVLITTLCIFFINLKNKIKNFKISKLSLSTLIVLIILLIEWFYNHPSLRYGGYCIIALILFIPLSIFFEKNKISIKKFNKSTSILLILTVIIFVGRNFDRINKEIELYNYKPINETYYQVTEHYFRVQKNMDELINEYNNCKNFQSDCNLNKQKISQNFNKLIFKVGK